MQERRIRVAVIDDHRVFAEALASRLSDEPDLEVVGTAVAAAEALELFSHNEIDVVALDLDLAGEDGLAVGRQLRDQWPDLGIVVVTAAADDSRVAEAVQMGVRGWVAKQSAIESLLTAVRGAARGETHLPAALLTRVLVSLSERNRSSTPEAEAIAILTARELDVLRCLIERTVPQRDWGALARLPEYSSHPHPKHPAQAQRSLRSHCSGVRSQGGSRCLREDEVVPPNDVRGLIRRRGSPADIFS